MKSRLNLVAVGDIFINGILADLTHINGCIYPFAQVSDAIADSEIKFGNLEGPFSTRGMPLEKCCLYSIPKAVDSLAAAGFNIISLANNHIFDYGCEAFEDTCSMLKKKGITWLGAGLDIRGATKPAIMEINGLRVGFLCYSWDFIGSIDATLKTPGVAPLNEKLIIKNVINLKQQVDTVVVSLHWGYERERYPLPYQRKMAHDIVDAGANLILGHHPHVLQGIEEYKNGVIVYSLGNFTFPDFHYKCFHLLQKEENRESIIFRCALSKKAVEQWDVIPIKSNKTFQPVTQDGNVGKRILCKITELSEPFSRKNYWYFWMKHRVRKDLPQIKGTSLYYRQKLNLYRVGLRGLKCTDKILSNLSAQITYRN